jgi:hypothetical protein
MKTIFRLSTLLQKIWINKIEEDLYRLSVRGSEYYNITATYNVKTKELKFFYEPYAYGENYDNPYEEIDITKIQLIQDFVKEIEELKKEV